MPIDETESAPTDELEAESEPDAGPAEVWDQDAEQIQEVKEYVELEHTNWVSMRLFWSLQN